MRSTKGLCRIAAATEWARRKGSALIVPLRASPRKLRRFIEHHEAEYLSNRLWCKSDALHVHIARDPWSGVTAPVCRVRTPMVEHDVGRCRWNILRVSRDEHPVHKEVNSVHTPNEAVLVKPCFRGPGDREDAMFVCA